MPCYEPPLEHDTRLPEFLTAALCFATAKLTQDEISKFPGLAEWKRRHAAIDTAENKRMVMLEYDRANGGGGYAPPKFMAEYMKAFPKPPR